MTGPGTPEDTGRTEPRRSGGVDPRLGMTVVHRRYVPYGHAHYAGHLVDGAYGLGLFGDAATELCIRSDGDEGLFASYSDVQFLAPVRAGDCVEVAATLVRVGTRSRTVDFRLTVVARGRPDLGESAAELLDEPLLATTATGVVVVPVRRVSSDTPESARFQQF